MYRGFILAVLALLWAQSLGAQTLTITVTNGKVANAARLNSDKAILVTDAPAFPAWHPNVVQIGSGLNIVGGKPAKLADLSVLSRFSLDTDQKSLVHASGDRLTLLRAYDVTSAFARREDDQVLLAQLEFAGSGQTVYFFVYRDPSDAVFSGPLRKAALDGYPAFRIAVPKRGAGFNPLMLSFASFDTYENQHRPVELNIRRARAGYMIPRAFHLVNPATPNGARLPDRLASYAKAVQAARQEQARAKADAAERRRKARIAAEAAKQAQQLQQQRNRSVADAFNDYILRDCNNLMALAQARDGIGVAGAFINTIRPRNGACAIDNFGISIRMKVRSVRPGRCDFSRSAGDCVATMQYSCSLQVKIGQQFDPLCPLMRIPFPVRVKFARSNGVLQVISLRAN